MSVFLARSRGVVAFQAEKCRKVEIGVIALRTNVATRMIDKEMFHSCESVDDVTFDLNGDQHTGLGWVVFEIEDGKQRQVTGAIGVSNNIFTLKLLRHLNSHLPLSIRGRFIDNSNQGAQSYTLENVMPSGTLFSDEIGFILFRANVSKLVQEREQRDKSISLLAR